MNLDELDFEIGRISSEKIAQDLSKFLLEWKDSTDTAEELQKRIDRYLGNTWIAENEDHEKIYNIWSSFCNEAIAKIEGMTMNERLYWFGLFNTSLDEETVYRKLHAKP